jgi:hypothetical protein
MVPARRQVVDNSAEVESMRSLSVNTTAIRINRADANVTDIIMRERVLPKRLGFIEYP